MLQALYCADTDDAAAPAVAQGARKRVSRLSVRRGRSVVHKNLEDNYGAVITANHEALAQILEQVKTLALFTFTIFHHSNCNELSCCCRCVRTDPPPAP